MKSVLYLEPLLLICPVSGATPSLPVSAAAPSSLSCICSYFKRESINSHCLFSNKDHKMKGQSYQVLIDLSLLQIHNRFHHQAATDTKLLKILSC